VKRYVGILRLLIVVWCLAHLVDLTPYGAGYTVDDLPKQTFTNPLWSGADPYVIFADGFYYFTFCDGDKRIYVTKSKTLTDRGEIRLVYTFPDGQWNSHLVWGPAALFRWDDGRWYIYYCAAWGCSLIEKGTSWTPSPG